MRPQVSIILINYRQAQLTHNCIASIKEHIGCLRYEIIVVDNASGDGSAEILQNIDGIKYLGQEENVGFGTANNRGVAEAQGEYIWILNNDTLLSNNAPEYLLRYMEEHKECGVAGGYLHHPDGQYCLSGGRLYTPGKYLWSAVRPLLPWKEKQEARDGIAEQEVGYVIGADMWMRKDVFEQVGGFDERIFMYFEDVELCQRLHNAGYSAMLIAGPEIIHVEGGSTGGQSLFYKTYNKASLMYVMSKKYSRWKFRMFQAAYFILKSPMLLLRWKEREYVLSIVHYKRYLRYR